ncbi:MAG: (2Fe-2S)-binding protein [Clostridiales bacterium GWB2_37_7]|nr:MAG: (2Fe-2S)-binding protein [Clostridiales bacterium GWB2_37_7]
MNLDEIKTFTKPPESYWMASTPTTNYPALAEDIKVDVAIVGGGIVGISCAYLLTKEGIQVAIIEADKILQGATGHTTAKVTSQHGLIYNKIKTKMGEELAKQYADANESAIRMIEKISKELNIYCDFTPQSAFIYTQQDKYVQKIQDEVQAASSFGIKAEYAEKIPLDISIKAAVRFDNQAQFHPRKYLLALAKEVISKGGSIYEQTRAVDIEENNPYVIKTKQGKKITADKVIIASHYPFYNKHGIYFARIYPERSYALAIKAKEKYPGGIYITAEDPGRSLRLINSEHGELIMVGGEHHKTGQGIDTVKHYEALVDFAAELFTVENIPYRWSTQDCSTLDDIPYVGHFTSDTPNMYVATGYGKWGMTNSTASAVILKDLILHGNSPNQDVYNPSRKTITASAKEFVKENLNVAKELLKGKLTPLPDDFEIKLGEGKVIDAFGERIGAFRDEQGALHLVNTTCTHLGCELQWNSAEKSWDCPCHGSRFSYNGDIIEGPAVMPLQYEINVNTLDKLINDDF